MTQPTPPDDGTPESETRPVNIKGRDVVVRQLVDTQMLYMLREARLLQGSEAPTARKVEATVDLLDILESTVVEEDDKAYLRKLMREGKLPFQDLLGIVSVFTEDQEPAKPKVRRARTPAKRR